jgi:hypothetical protein
LALLLEVLGVLAATAISRRLLGGSWAGGVAVVVTVLAVVVVFNTSWPVVTDLLEQRADNAKLTPAQHRSIGGVPMAAREDFLQWVDSRLPKTSRLLLVCSPLCGGIDQWVTYRLGPRPFVDHLKDADYVVLYSARPRDARLRGEDARRAIEYDDRFMLVPAPR